MLDTSRRTLVIVAFSTLVGCTTPAVPATMPDVSAQALRLYATSATLPLVTDLTGAYTERQLTFETRTGNFRTALDALIEGDAACIFTSYLPPPEMLPVSLWAAPVGQDGIAVIVNPLNPITALSLDQLRELYQGRIAGWHDLGWQQPGTLTPTPWTTPGVTPPGIPPDLAAGPAITVFSREDGSDTRAAFERLVMGQRRTTLAARLVSSSSGMIEAVANTPGGIGYVSLAHLTDTVRALAIEGVAPTTAGVQDSTYPLRLTVYVVGLQEPADAYRAFIGWIQSPPGQTIVARQYIPLMQALPVP